MDKNFIDKMKNKAKKFLHDVDEKVKEASLKRQHELIDSMHGKLHDLKTVHLDDIDLLSLEDAHEAIADLHDTNINPSS